VPLQIQHGVVMNKHAELTLLVSLALLACLAFLFFKGPSTAPVDEEDAGGLSAPGPPQVKSIDRIPRSKVRSSRVVNPVSVRGKKKVSSSRAVNAFPVSENRPEVYISSWAYAGSSRQGSFASEGGSQATEAAVVSGLRWLHFHQDKPSGKWDSDDYQKNCKGPGSPCANFVGNKPEEKYADSDVGVSALSILAFLGHGQTHRVGRFKRTVRRGLKYLKNIQSAGTGVFGNASGEGWMVNHALATAAMCEAFAVTRDNVLKGPAQKAVDYILQSQNPGFGWGFGPKDGKSSTLVTGWVALALDAASMGKLIVPRSAVDGAMAWFDRVTRATDGEVGDMRSDDGGVKFPGDCESGFESLPAPTAASVFCRIFCGRKRSSRTVRQGIKILMAHLPDYNKPECDKVDFLYWHFGTNAMFQFGGPDWRTWGTAMKEALLKSQRAGRICQDGSWDPVGKGRALGGRVCSTAINVLTLEVYYRYKRVR